MALHEVMMNDRQKIDNHIHTYTEQVFRIFCFAKSINNSPYLKYTYIIMSFEQYMLISVYGSTDNPKSCMRQPTRDEKWLLLASRSLHVAAPRAMLKTETVPQ